LEAIIIIQIFEDEYWNNRNGIPTRYHYIIICFSNLPTVPPQPTAWEFVALTANIENIREVEEMLRAYPILISARDAVSADCI